MMQGAEEEPPPPVKVEEGPPSKKRRKGTGWTTMEKPRSKFTTAPAGSDPANALLSTFGTVALTLQQAAPVLDSDALNSSRLHLLAQQLGLTEEDMKHARELCVSNLPPRTSNTALTEFLNAALIALKGKAVSGNPVSRVVLAADMPKEDVFHPDYAIIEFRTMEEANNAMALNGVNFHKYSMRLARTKLYPEPLLSIVPAQQIVMPGSSSVVNGYLTGVPQGQPVNIEALGPAFSEQVSRIGPVVAQHGGNVTVPPEGLVLKKLPPPDVLPSEKIKEFLETFGSLKLYLHTGLPDLVSVRKILSDHITKRDRYDMWGFPKQPIKQDEKPEDIVTTNVMSEHLGVTCFDQILNHSAPTESICFFEFHSPLDAQHLTLYMENEVGGDFSLGEIVPLEQTLADDDRLRAIFHFTLRRRIQPVADDTLTALRDLVVPTRVLCFQRLLAPDEMDGENLSEVVDDIRAECKLTGKVLVVELIRKVHRPTTTEDGTSSTALVAADKHYVGPSSILTPSPFLLSLSDEILRKLQGYIFVEFATVADACRSRRSLNGRKFKGRPVDIIYFSERKWADADLSVIEPNSTKIDSSTFRPELSNHVPELLEKVEAAEKIAREAARIAATAAANAHFQGGMSSMSGPPPPPMLIDGAKPNFETDVVRDDEEMDMEED